MNLSYLGYELVHTALAALLLLVDLAPLLFLDRQAIGFGVARLLVGGRVRLNDLLLAIHLWVVVAHRLVLRLLCRHLRKFEEEEQYKAGQKAVRAGREKGARKASTSPVHNTVYTVINMGSLLSRLRACLVFSSLLTVCCVSLPSIFFISVAFVDRLAMNLNDKVVPAPPSLLFGAGADSLSPEQDCVLLQFGPSVIHDEFKYSSLYVSRSVSVLTPNLSNRLIEVTEGMLKELLDLSQNRSVESVAPCRMLLTAGGRLQHGYSRCGRRNCGSHHFK